MIIIIIIIGRQLPMGWDRHRPAGAKFACLPLFAAGEVEVGKKLMS